MNNEPITIRNLEVGDIPAAMEFVISEGWNQTEKDWMLMIASPSNVCKAAEFEGKLVGTIASMNYVYDKAWISMVLVHKDFRGRGISRMLLDSSLNELSSCKSIKLDATAAGLSGYKKFGFFDEYQILEMVNLSFEGLSIMDDEITPQQVKKEDIPSIAKFDKVAFVADRSALIEYLVNNFPEKSWFVKQNNEIAGYAFGREGNKYHRIDPVSAGSSADAKILIGHALRKMSSHPVLIDILEEKNELIEWLSSLGFTERRRFTRMSHHSNPFPGRVDLLYVIAGPEFG